MTNGRESKSYPQDELNPGLAPQELAKQLDGWVKRATEYTRRKKVHFRLLSSTVKTLSLSMSATSTIVLGLQDLNFWASLGFSLVALTTVLNAVEPFFNWRSRWVLMEEGQHQFYRLHDQLAFHLSRTGRDDLKPADIEAIFKEYVATWDDLGERWIQYRRMAEGGQPAERSREG